jgi:hypothetical protein
VIKSPWIELILDRKKTWELRGSSTRIRGRIALIRKGSGAVVGHCDVVGVVGPLSRADLLASTRMHRVDPRDVGSVVARYRRIYAWILSNASRLRKPMRYRHPSGAVIWVNLDG